MSDLSILLWSKFSIFYCFVIFLKFLDEIEDNAPEHHTK